MYTMKRRPSNETKETTGKFVFPSVLRHFRLRHKISGKNTYYQTQYKKRLYNQIPEGSNFLSDQMEKGKRTLDAPLLVKNPYGTLSTSIYFYAVSTEPLYAKYTITAKGAETISGTLAGGSEANVRLTHEYLIPGLAAGRKIQ